jgi:putative cofactor-binding repeat protein
VENDLNYRRKVLQHYGKLVEIGKYAGKAWKVVITGNTGI